MASTLAPSAPVRWASSGAGTPRHDRILELHKLHFVHKKGHDAVKETIEARCKENRKADAHAAKEHTARLQDLNDKMTQKVKDSMAGSMSIRTKEEREKIEELRQDPDEAKERMTKHVREQARSYKDQKSEMMDKVNSKPPMNIRPKAEREEIEIARQDPEEAKQRMTAHMAQRKETFMTDRKAMSARVKAAPPVSFRPKSERDRIEELRQDPDEARAKMQKHIQHVAKTYRAEKSEMNDRVWSKPPMNIRDKDEIAMIEEARQDPEEAKQKMKEHMKLLAATDKARTDDITVRVRARPPMNIRPKEERARIEEARQDPDEARQKMMAHMRELSHSYKENKRQIHERVHAIPPQTFRSAREQDTVGRKLLKSLPLK